MKLNTKRTCLVGLAFLSISAFWGLYDFVIPLVLKNTYGLGDTWAGVVMAMDNVLALFLLPFFGALSDKVRSPLGRRMPFIMGGTMAAVTLMLALALVIRVGTLGVFLACLALLLLAMGVDPIAYYTRMFTMGMVGNKIAYKSFENYLRGTR